MREKKSKKILIDPRYAKGSKYTKVIKEIQNEGVCPFCPASFKWHTKPILKTEGNWFITENFNPYKNTQHHFLIIGKKHKELLSELTMLDLQAVWSLACWAIKKFQIEGGGIILRFGDTLYTGATIKHLHLHLIKPSIKAGKVKPVFFPIG